jgi:hypothetical protein
MYGQQIESIESKIKELSERAKLKKLPRLKRFKGSMPPAYHFGQLNQLGVSERARLNNMFKGNKQKNHD